MHIDIHFISNCKQMQTQSKLDIVDEKYQRTIIYGLVCLITKEKYVGSTVQTLDERITDHIRLRDCSAWQILERGNYKAYVIQHYPCNTLRERLVREGAWQKAYQKSFGEKLVNRQIEGSFANESPEARQAYDKANKKQYRNEHKDERQAYDKQYYTEHKEERQVYTKQYRKQSWTCEWCNKTMTTGGRYYHKKSCKNKPVECHTIQ